MQNQRAFHDLLVYVWKNSRFYHELYQKHGIREQDLPYVKIQDLPLVTKEILMDNFDEVVIDPRLKKKELQRWLDEDHDATHQYLNEYNVLYSSGSSGIYSIAVYNDTAWRTITSLAVPYLWSMNAGGPTKIKHAFFIGERGHIASGTAAVNSSLALNEILLVTMLDPGVEVVEKLSAFQPDRITSNSSSMARLAELTLAGRLYISPRDIVVTSDQLSPAMEAVIREAWDPKIYNQYGASESVFLALKQPGEKEWKAFDELNILEILNNDNQPVAEGAIGRVYLTNLYNTITPYIRYDLNDYAIAGLSQPGQTTLRGFAGKTFDVLPVLLDDQRVGEIPSYELINFQVPGLEAVQFIPFRPDYLEIEYCSKEDISKAVEDAFQQLLIRKGAAQTHFKTRRVNAIWNETKTFKLKLIGKPPSEQVTFSYISLIPEKMGLSQNQVRPQNAYTPFPREQLEESISVCFERQATRRPGAIALKDSGKSLTYHELNQVANRIAHLLIEAQLKPNRAVGLFFNHNAAMITAILGTLKAGGFYVPLDPSNPKNRNTDLLIESQADILLTDGEGMTMLNGYGLSGVTIINLDEIDPKTSCENPNLQLSPETPACLLFTSGSTGKPKGILLDQRAVLHRAMLYTNDYHLCETDRLSLIQLYQYNASVREIFGALLNGAGLFLYNLKKEGVHHLAEWLQAERITVFYTVPAVFRVFLETLQGESFNHIRLVRLGGEAVRVQEVEGFQRHFGPDCILANGLASTETGATCQYFFNRETRITGKLIPVGYPVKDKSIFFLDEEGAPVKDGEIGEMVVESAYLGPGEFHPGDNDRQGSDPDSPLPTRRIYTKDLGFRAPDGRIFLVGRKDWMVKIRGQRINLAEIEQALLRLDSVADAAAVCHSTSENNPILTAYIQLKQSAKVSEEKIRAQLRETLPEVMLPSGFMFLEALPKTLSNKVDRLALPKPEPKLFGHHPDVVLPETELEHVLVEIWQEVLNLPQVGLDDNFFDQGGDSLVATLLMLKIEEKIGKRLPLVTLLENNSIRKIASFLVEGDTQAETSSLFALQPLGDKAPVYFAPGIGGEVLSLQPLIAKMGQSHPFFGLQGSALDQISKKNKTIEQMAADYIHEIRAIRPHGPYFLAGYSFGGHVALEMGRQLLALGEAVPWVALLDTIPPGPGRNAPFFARILIHFQNFGKLNGFKDYTSYLTDRLKRIFLRTIRHEPARRLAQQIGLQPKSHISAARMAFALYNPQPYPGNVILFTVSQREWYVTWDPMEKWKDYILGKLEIRSIPGEHGTLINDPNTNELAQQLNECLERDAG